MAQAAYFPDDVLASLFSFFPDNSEFPANREKIHKAIFELSNDEPSIFQLFVFNKDKLFPTCKEIDQALNNLEMSDFLKKYNPELKIYTISPSIKDYFHNRLEANFQDKIAALKSLSKRFQEALSTA